MLSILHWKGRNLGGKKTGFGLGPLSLSHQLFYYFTVVMINELSKIIIIINEI